MHFHFWYYYYYYPYSMSWTPGEFVSLNRGGWAVRECFLGTELLGLRSIASELCYIHCIHFLGSANLHTYGGRRKGKKPVFYRYDTLHYTTTLHYRFV